ncbi:MAG: hypothetical protein K5Q00_08315, partial [Gammaproteobacteria bacterium]|nr:hypothetical protein [Gammaproteobacteria bacterium]
QDSCNTDFEEILKLIDQCKSTQPKITEHTEKSITASVIYLALGYLNNNNVAKLFSIANFQKLFERTSALDELDEPLINAIGERCTKIDFRSSLTLIKLGKLAVICMIRFLSNEPSDENMPSLWKNTTFLTWVYDGEVSAQAFIFLETKVLLTLFRKTGYRFLFTAYFKGTKNKSLCSANKTFIVY